MSKFSKTARHKFKIYTDFYRKDLALSDYKITFNFFRVVIEKLGLKVRSRYGTHMVRKQGSLKLLNLKRFRITDSVLLIFHNIKKSVACIRILFKATRIIQARQFLGSDSNKGPRNRIVHKITVELVKAANLKK